MNADDLRQWYGQPLRTRERAAIEVARGALRQIAQADLSFDDVKEAAERALVRIAEIMSGERS